MHTILLALIILVLGLIYLSQASGPVTYDHQADELNKKIDELAVKKADLEVENARLSSLETVRHSDVAKVRSVAPLNHLIIRILWTT